MALNIIGDIAGQFKTLEALLKKMPEGTPVSVGDMVDRGPQSRDVIQFFMENGKAVMGNHEHLMLDYVDNTGIYDPRIWFYNGGFSTVKAYAQCHLGPGEHEIEHDQIRSFFDKEHIEWIKALPLYMENDDEFGKILITHAPVNPVFGLERAVADVKSPLGGANSVIWNRGSPRDMKGYDLQIYGHNASNGVKWFGHAPMFHSVCIDTSHAKILTGIHWPSREIFQQEYLD